MGYDSRLARSDTGFMCCICFDWVLFIDAYTDPAGVKWDMCVSCGKKEE